MRLNLDAPASAGRVEGSGASNLMGCNTCHLTRLLNAHSGAPAQPVSVKGVSQGELMVVFGPPAVGKMTVGRAVCARSHFRLFLNHHTIELLADVFGMDTAPFRALTGEFRRRLVEEAAAAEVPLMLTLVWNLGGVEDARWVSELVSPYASAGLPVSFVELAADLEARLERNRGLDRLLAKPSKRDLVWSEAHLREREHWLMNSDPKVPMAADGLLAAHRHLRLDTRHAEPQVTAERIIAWHAAV